MYFIYLFSLVCVCVWGGGGLAPLAWFFVINISVRPAPDAPEPGGAWGGTGGELRPPRLRPDTAQLCSDPRSDPSPARGWAEDGAGTCPGPGKGRGRGGVGGGLQPPVGMDSGSRRAQRGAGPGLSALGRVRTRRGHAVDTLFTGNKYNAGAQGCRHFHSLFSGRYSNAFLRTAGHGDTGDTSARAPRPAPRPTAAPRCPPRPPGTPYSLSGGRGGPADQPGLARAHLVDAEGESPGRDVAALGQRQAPLAHALPVLPSAAAAGPALLVPLAPRSWWHRESGLKGRRPPLRPRGGDPQHPVA